MIVETIISTLIKNKSFFDRVHDKIFKYNARIFDSRTDQYIIKMLEKYFTSKSIILNFDDLLLKVENNKKIEESVYQQLKVRINELKEYNIDITLENIKDETKKYIQDTLTEKFIYKCSEFLGDEKNNTSHQELLDEMEEIANIDFDSNIGYFANDKTLFKDYFVNKISFNFDPLDELSFGGLPKKTLNMIYGAAHAGKTQIMIHIACNLARAGKKVLFATSELSAEMLKQRIDSWFFQMPSWKISPKYMSDKQYDEMIDVANEAMKNINIVEFSTEGSNAHHVKEHYERLVKDHDFKCDIILVDSINQMGSIKKVSGEQPHIKLKYVFTEFRALAFLLDLPIISPTHLSDEGEREISLGDDVKTNHMGEFKMLKAIADFIIGFKQMYVDKNGTIFKDRNFEKCIDEDYELPKNEDFDRLCKLNILKSRYGSRVGESLYLGSNIDYSKFYDFRKYVKNCDTNSNKTATYPTNSYAKPATTLKASDVKNNKKENIINKSEDSNTNNDSVVVSGSFNNRKKRKQF